MTPNKSTSSSLTCLQLLRPWLAAVLHVMSCHPPLLDLKGNLDLTTSLCDAQLLLSQSTAQTSRRSPKVPTIQVRLCLITSQDQQSDFESMSHSLRISIPSPEIQLQLDNDLFPIPLNPSTQMRLAQRIDSHLLFHIPPNLRS